ncbi:MAG: hypothetical protein HYV07_28210 [Deltaproteobacteria bacterium]|nr:hypothetical protein [Deltaproteobacteria bacterium]
MKPAQLLALAVSLASPAVAGAEDLAGTRTPTDASALEDFVDAGSTGADSVEGAPPVGRVRATWHFDAQLATDLGHEAQDAHVGRLDLGARVAIDAELSESTSIFVEPDVRYTAAISADGEDREALLLDAPEAFARLTFGPLRLRAGNLIFAWGASDLVGPSDVLNPLDLRTSLFADVEAVKLPVLGVEVSVGLGPLTLRLALEPVFFASRFRIEGWDTALDQAAVAAQFPLPRFGSLLSDSEVDRALDQAIVIDRPSDSPENATVGLRSTLRLGLVDLGATFVHGFDPLPRLNIDRDVAILTDKLLDGLANGTSFDLSDPELLGAIGRIRDAQEQGRTLISGTYDRRTVVGFDGSVAIDPVLLKVDLAYSTARTLYTQAFRPVSHPWVNVVAGLELAHGETLAIDVEAFAIVVIDVRSSYRLLFLEARAPPPSSADVGFRTIAVPGVAAAGRARLLDGDLELVAGVLATFARGDYAIMPRARYAFDDASSMTLGAILVGGRADGFGGVYSHLDEVFVAYRLSL